MTIRCAASTRGEVPDFAIAARRLAPHRIGIDGNSAALDAHRIEFQGIKLPTAGDLPIGEIKGGEVPRTDQAAAFDAPLRQVRFFVWAGALEGKDGVAVARQHQRMIVDQDSEKTTVRQLAQFGDDDEAWLSSIILVRHVEPSDVTVSF
jgi:hypothetical protein